MFTLPSIWYDWNTVEKDVNPKTIQASNTMDASGNEYNGNQMTYKCLNLTGHKIYTGYNWKSKVSSFKSNENSHKKEDESYYIVSANKASSVTM